MRTRTTTRAIVVVLMTLVGRTPQVDAQKDTAQRRATPENSNGAPVFSSGEYMGRKWRIDKRRLMLWGDKPYVRFGFTGNGEIAQMRKAGFDQFTLMPAEEWPILGPDPKIVQAVNDTSDQLEKAGSTYYGTLNAFWPWRYGSLIAESDKAAVFVRDVRDVTEYSGRRLPLDLQFALPIHEAEWKRLGVGRSHAVLFDLERGGRVDLSDKVQSVTPAVAETDSEAPQGNDGERNRGKRFRVRLKSIRFPESSCLRVVLAVEIRLAELPGVHGLPALWKPGIRTFYQRSLEAFRPAYAKPGLRGLQFGDEINTHPLSLLTAQTYLDIRRDAVALKAYREWLAQRFGSIEQLNRHLSSSFAAFDRVDWVVPLHPFAPRLARTDDAAEREESWAGAKTAWGLAKTVEQLRRISRLQEDFRQWFYGHWLAEYAKLAKEVVGPVPVFVCSAGIGGDADRYLAMHRWALCEGVDGLIRNHYGHAGEDERHTLASLARWMAKVEQQSGCTKHLWANEVGYVRPNVTDNDWEAAERTELGVGDSFGSQWAFPSQESLRETLVLLNQYGYRGFNRFLMNPSSPRAAREVKWMARLRADIVPLVVQTKKPAPIRLSFTREQAIAAARENRRIQEALRRIESVHTQAEFSERWDVWLVHFYSGDRRIAFASVNQQGEVLEVETGQIDDREWDDRRQENR